MTIKMQVAPPASSSDSAAQCPLHEWQFACCPPECRERRRALGEPVVRDNGSYTYGQEEQVLPPLRPVTCSEPVLHPSHAPLSQLDRRAVWVHLTGNVSHRIIREVVEHCRGLQMIQVVPSEREGLGDISPLLTLLAARGIGFRFARSRVSDMT